MYVHYFVIEDNKYVEFIYCDCAHSFFFVVCHLMMCFVQSFVACEILLRKKVQFHLN